MKMNAGVDVESHTFLTSALDGGEWSASRSGRFIPRDNVPSTYFIGGWVGPRTSLDDVEKEKILHLLGLFSQMSVKHYKMTNGREKTPKYLEKNLPKCHFIYKRHMGLLLD
jgi:hypothetical protein